MPKPIPYNPIRRLAGEWLIKGGPIRMGALEFQVIDGGADTMALIVVNKAGPSHLIACNGEGGMFFGDISPEVKKRLKPHKDTSPEEMFKLIEQLGEAYAEAVEHLSIVLKGGSPMIDAALLALDDIEEGLKELFPGGFKE
jgi:hypothetical protein